MPNRFVVILLLILGVMGSAFALTPEDLLPPDQAFRFTAKAKSDKEVALVWRIADGYYLYRNKFHIETDTTGSSLGDPAFPIGKKKHDDLFGEVEIYRGTLTVFVPLKQRARIDQITLKIVYQGCADVGVCYPPQKKTVTVRLPPPAVVTKPSINNLGAFEKFTRSIKNLGQSVFQDELLPADQAFQLNAQVKDGETLSVHWQIADGYYLYREKFGFSIPKNEAV
ncbi:MAG: protein-disulfide reductase DsbD domain-containing protein, partial [Methylococcales bacterium]